MYLKYLIPILLTLLFSNRMALADPNILYDGETAKFGKSTSWDKNGSLIVQKKLNPYSKPNHLFGKLIVKRTWGGIGYAPNSWLPINFSGKTSFSMMVRANKVLNLKIALFDKNKKQSQFISLPIDTTYKKQQISIASVSDNIDLSNVTAIVFGGSDAGTYNFFVDDIKFDDTAPTPTPTPTPTPSPTPTPTTGALDFGSDGILQIHPVGDSITNHPGWRCRIFNDLTQNGIKSEFIGSLTDQYPECSQSKHDGHSGYNTNNTGAEYPGWASGLKKPELTILMLGTNDVAWWIAEPISAVVTRLSTLIDKIEANAPAGTVIVASIPPESSKIVQTVNRDRSDLTNEYNKGVAALIATRQQKGEKIHFVDINAVLTVADLYDGIHPKVDTGNAKIAAAFSAKIKSLIGSTPPTPSPTPIPTPTPTPTPTPIPTTGATMKTQGRFLYDACGEKVVLKGYNHMTCWTDWAGTPRDGLPMFSEMAKTGANVVRMTWIQDAGAGVPAITTAQLDAAMGNAIANKLIPMPEIHDYTCQWSTQAITNTINFWTKPDVVAIFKKYERFALLNFANEMSAPNATEYVKEYTRALVAIRSAGIHVPIVLDSSSCGQDEAMILNAAPALIKADPDHNVIMSLHIYWTDQNAARIAKIVSDSIAANIPMIIGEFASVSVDCKTPILWQEIIKQGQINEIGWMPWSWDNQNACATHAMTTDNTYNGLKPGWGLDIAVSNPYSVKNTAVIPYSIVNGKCK